MLLPIYVLGNPVLRKIAQDIPEDYKDLQKLIDDMFQTMDEADGVGLAAPQIGKSIRLFVIDASAFEEMEAECKGYRRAFINAHITERYGDIMKRNEGCLSLPGIHEDVERPNCIKMTYMDVEGKTHTEEFSGVKAWIIQHEYDHLDGVVFTDHLSQLRKRLIKGKLQNISCGKFRSTYRVAIPK